MSKKILFDKCVKEAIEIGRPHLHEYDYEYDNKPTKQEWELALLLFQMETR